MFQESDKPLIMRLATDSIQHGLTHGEPLPVDIKTLPAVFQKNAAAFVTLLDRSRQLRGCIGTLEAHQPLAIDIARNAYAAAFSDLRFTPVTEAERLQLTIKVSILTPPELMTFTSEADLLSQLRPNVDGLILEDNGHRGTFLPSVWEMLPTPKQFFDQLKGKAGLPSDYWSETLKVSRYTTIVIE